ncbi:MAG: hypothetical protein KC468_35730, partial [Myxococcales bacterium]|nr:hypothetical protein [Myxococcales bacterium]
MGENKRLTLLVALALAGACGDDGASSASEAASASEATSAASTSPETSEGASGSTSDATSGSGSDSATGSTTGDDTTAGTATSVETSMGVKFDVAEMPDVGVDACDALNCGESEWSYIWIANSSESTVSKINTRTLVEEGRFLTRDTPGNPSRTSVSIDGRAVAVANRNGGIIKIWARPEDCAGDSTSTGAGDVKAWGEDDCVAWYTPFPEAASQRPVAWTSGVWSDETCQWEDQKVWVGEGRGPGVGFCDDDKIYVHRLNGDTGAVEETVELSYPCTTFGLYGGVVDSNNDFWVTRLFEGSPGALRIDYDTLTHDEAPAFYGYGITVDHEGLIWGGTGKPGKWDPGGQTWTAIVDSVNNVGVGLAEDQQDRMWVGMFGGIQAIDVASMTLLDAVLFEGEMSQCKGISVDVDGYIWAVPESQDRAYKVDPDTLDYEMFTGLVGAYTYSDMTG